MNSPAAAKLLKKISPATVVGEINPDLPSPIKEARNLFDLFGVVVKTRSGKSNYGDWTSFVGQFEAVTPDGEIYASPRAFIPQPFEDMLFAQLAQAQEADPKATVQFAVRVSVVPPAKGKPSASGYEFRVTPLLDTQENNPLALLRQAANKAAGAITHQPDNMRAIGGSKK